MRILVVSGPHAFATRDMFTGHTWGLRQLLGEDNVHTYDIIPRYKLFSLFADVLEEKFGKGNVPREIRANVLAAEPIFAKAHLVRADWVYFLSPMYMPMSFVQLLRADGFKCAVYFTECPYEDHLWASTQAKHFDVCFVNDRNSVTPFQIYNPQSYYLAHSYVPERHWPRWDRVNQHQHVVFVGTNFPSRVRLLEAVDWDGIDLRLYGNWQEVTEDQNLARYVRHRLVDNHTTGQLYRGSVVGLSMHRQERHWDFDDRIQLGEAYSVGPRT